MGTGKRSVLIAGGAEFIGVNLANRAIRAGHRVTLLDDLSRRGSQDNLAWLRSQHGDGFDLVVGSIADQHLCERTVAAAEVVYHLAARTAVMTSVRRPRSGFTTSALGTFGVLATDPAPGMVESDRRAARRRAAGWGGR